MGCTSSKPDAREPTRGSDGRAPEEVHRASGAPPSASARATENEGFREVSLNSASKKSKSKQAETPVTPVVNAAERDAVVMREMAEVVESVGKPATARARGVSTIPKPRPPPGEGEDVEGSSEKSKSQRKNERKRERLKQKRAEEKARMETVAARVQRATSASADKDGLY